MTDFTPTTEQVRDGSAIDPEAEYRDPLTNHTPYGQRAFDRWLAEHDRAVSERAWSEGRTASIDLQSDATGFRVVARNADNPYRSNP